MRTLGQRDDESRLIADMARAAEALGDRGWQAAAVLAAAMNHALLTNYERARLEELEAYAVYGELDDLGAQIACLCLLADVASQSGELDEARSRIVQARELAEAQGNPSMVARAMMSASGAVLMRNEFSQCIELCESAAYIYRSIGDREGEADAFTRAGSAAVRLLRFDDARAYDSAARAIYEAIGKRQGTAVLLINASNVAARLGDLTRACELLEDARKHFEALQDARGKVLCNVNISALRVWNRDAGAKAAAVTAVEQARELGLPVLEAAALANLGAAERSVGEASACIDHITEALAIRRDLSRPADSLNDIADLTLAYVDVGDIAAAQRCADELLAAAQSSTAGAFWPQYCFWAAARAYRAAGKKKRALELLRRARAVVDEVAAAISDLRDRDVYIKSEINREIMDASERQIWPA
jgi:tetratricopeptide (TPR) repeat protein